MRSIFLVVVVAFLAQPLVSSPGLLGVGQSLTQEGIRVTLLDAMRVTRDEYTRIGGETGSWKGGGLRLAFLVENRPGAPLPAALGEVRVFFGSSRYNDVTSFTSSKALAPDVAIQTPDDFFSRPEWLRLRNAAPTPRNMTIAQVLDVIVRGGPIPAGVPGIVEFEQGETFRQGADGRLYKLTSQEMAWITFRFDLPKFD